jgi:hypothetical protein
MSWNGDTGTPSFSIKMRCSKVFGAPILRTVYLDAMFVLMLTEAVDDCETVREEYEEELEKCRAICADRAEILIVVFGDSGSVVGAEDEGRRDARVVGLWPASVN